MRWGATTTGCCAASCRRSPNASRAAVGNFGYRVFTDSAPVLEVALAAKSGIGWRGKHTLLLTRDQGSWFFLWRDLHRPAAADDDAAKRALRHLHRVHRGVPHRRDRRAVRARRTPLHFVSDDRACGRDPGANCGR
jgi:hypothetical protein